LGDGGGLTVAILAFGASRCSICGDVLHPGQAIVATTHFIADQADPLWRFSDTGMHAACFAAWEHRDEFAARYYAALGRTTLGWVPAVPANPASPPTARSRLAVLGTPEERAGYFEDLEARIAQHAEPSHGAESR
jgi:hypothetical protein